MSAAELSAVYWWWAEVGIGGAEPVIRSRCLKRKKHQTYNEQFLSPTESLYRCFLILQTLQLRRISVCVTDCCLHHQDRIGNPCLIVRSAVVMKDRRTSDESVETTMIYPTSNILCVWSHQSLLCRWQVLYAGFMAVPITFLLITLDGIHIYETN